jgi:hypothetical protein
MMEIAKKAHQYLMESLGFSNRWINWTKNILESATTSILLNGVPGRNIHCKRGVRQEDPLSPLLFVLAADLLQCVINKAHQQGLFQLPIPSRDEASFPIIQYADDTILLLRASQKELFCVKGILETYAQATSLRVNYAKSCMVPLNMDPEQAQILAGVFGCQLQGMPFTYLGLPMGKYKPRVIHFAPLMHRIERQLTSTSSMLTHARKLQLVNPVLSSLPTYFMCSVAILVEVQEYIDRARRHCLWRKSDSNAKSKPLVAWRKCTRPKKKGGLGIINLRSQNTALLLKHLDNFFNKRNISWVNLIWNTYYSNGNLSQATKGKCSFWWKDLLKLIDTFRSVDQCVVGDGSTVMFWPDLWNGNLLQQKFPRHYSFAKNKSISVAAFLQNDNLEQQFFTPLSPQAYQEYLDLQEVIQQTQITTSGKDHWKYIWGDDKYTSSKFYNFPYKNVQPPSPFIWIWNSSCSNKIKIFTYLLLMDRLNARNILKGKKQKLEGNNYNCPLCTMGREETTFHLFFSCPFSQHCWNHLNIKWNFNLDFYSMMLNAREQFGSNFFMEIFMIAAWLI